MKPQQWAAAGAATATVLLTGFAFWLSYEHLHDVSAGNGLSGARAWAWPACLDLFIVIGELLMLRASLLRSGMDWWAVALMVTGSGGSIALNVAGVGSGAPKLTYVVAAVPPVAALLAFGALMRQVHDHLAVEPEPAVSGVPDTSELIEVPAGPAPEPVVIERVTETEDAGARFAPALTLGPLVPVAELLAGTGREQGDRGSFAGTNPYAEPVEPSAARTEPEPVAPEPEAKPQTSSGGVPAERIRAAREWLAAEPELTGTEIGRRLGTSDSYGRRVRTAALAAG
ncbi:DUF2637 domain-containing protein [Streptomyces polygonati]|uniref:DUF2637 domain-containing protein n=1 Tax=Streptomyces polygonati TaxID=1617087 RepID=A0ABV8HUA5_9ACTN